MKLQDSNAKILRGGGQSLYSLPARPDDGIFRGQDRCLCCGTGEVL